MENHAPCLDKNCGYCCDPVKVNVKNHGEPPKDKNGNDIFIPRIEFLIPESRPDTDRIKTFDCKNFDPITKKCLDHDNRPDMCRNATCISDPNGNIDEQHNKVVSENFIKIFPR
jgi:Fe-S-cluster containining protein